MTGDAPGDSVRLCDSCGWRGDPNMTPPPEGASCPVCGEGVMRRYLLADPATGGPVVVGRVALAALADYCRDEILMRDVQDDDLTAAVRAAYDALDHDDAEFAKVTGEAHR